MSELVLSELAPAAAEIAERQRAIQLSESAWEELIALTDGRVPATPLALREAAEFMARFQENRQDPEA